MKTEDYLYESLALCREYGLTSIYIVYKDLGNLFRVTGDFENAIINYLKSLEYGLKFRIIFFTKTNLLGIGISLFKTDRAELALRIFSCLNTILQDSHKSIVTQSDKLIKEEFEEHLLKIKELLGNEICEKYFQETKNIKSEDMEKFVLELF